MHLQYSLQPLVESHSSSALAKPSPHVTHGYLTQIVGEVVDPPVHVYPGADPEQSLRQPFYVPASQTSGGTTKPSPQISQEFFVATIGD